MARFAGDVYTRLELDKDSPNAVIDKSLIASSSFIKSDLPYLPTASAGRGPAYSMVSMEWLFWQEAKLQNEDPNLQIRHALSSEGEYRLPDGSGYCVDGACIERLIMYEFWGCHYHSCKLCYPHNRAQLRHPTNNQTMNDLYRQTKDKEKYIKLHYPNWKLVTIWECRWSRFVLNFYFVCLNQNDD